MMSFSHPTGGSLCKLKSPSGVFWILKALRGCMWSLCPYNIAWQNWSLLLFQHGRILLTCEPNGDRPSCALWDRVALPLWPHLHLFVALHPSFLLCLFTQRSTVWERFLRDWCRIPLFISVPVREWVLGEDRLCKSGFQKEELCISEHRL